MPDEIEIDKYQGVGGCYVIDPDTGERRPAEIPPSPPLSKGGERSGGEFDLAEGAAAPGATDKPTKPAKPARK